MKKFLIGLLVFFVVLIGALFAVPYLFKDQITARIKKAANENLTATLDFKDADLSVFRHFPQLSVGLEELDITGTGAFEGVKLVQCERLDVTVDLWSAIFGDQIDIKGLFFKRPDIRVYVLADGRANYDIAKPEPDVTKPSATEEGSAIRLERYGIEDGKVLYDDRALDLRAELLGLEHEGSGEFTADIYDLVMKTAVQKASFDYGGTSYLVNSRTDWGVTLNADMKSMKFTIKDNDLKVNDLQLMLDGWIQMPANSEDIGMDLTFSTPQNTFKSFLSIIPGAYTKDFKDVQTNGTVQFAGFVKGIYNEKTYPAFKIDFKVGNADFKYPSLPLGVTDINVDASINSPSQRLNDMTVNIPAFRLKIGSNPLEGRFFLKTPETDPTVDMRLNGTLNLGELAKAFPMEGVQELSGIIKANVTMKAAMSQLERQLYDQVDMAGDFAMTGINYRAEGQPPVTINALTTTLTPQRVEIKNFDAKLGRSDLRASGAIDNVLAYFSTTKTMRGNLVFTSNYFDANEWMEPAPADGSQVPGDAPAATTTSATEKIFDRWDFTMDGKVNRLKYDTYDLTNLDMRGNFTPNRMTVDDFGMKIGASDLHGNGTILNAWDYLFDNRTVSGVVNLRSMYFDANYFMTDPPAPVAGPPGKTVAVPPAEVMLVPENIDMTLNIKMDKVKYTNMDLNNLDGQIIVKNGAARLRDCTAQVLGGQVGLTGEYNTQDPAKPAFNVDLALQNMGFKDAFQTFATVKALAPVAQLIDGKFNTTLSMSGLLGKDMVPDFSTLSAAGFIETLSAILNNFKPLNEISTKLNIAYLNKLELKNSKNWFEIKNGAVTVKPFNVQMRDVAMQIGGTHSISNEMNYQITTKAPRKLLGTAANSGLDYLSKEASKYGVNLAQGEFINVRFDLTGSLFSPKVAMKVLGSDGESSLKEETTATIKATMDKARDSLTNVANRELEKGKQKAAAAAQKAADSLRVLADKKIKEATDKATQQAKDKLGKEVGEKVGTEATKKAEEVLGDKGTKTVEDAKKKLEDWDPFKKKKKEN